MSVNVLKNFIIFCNTVHEWVMYANKKLQKNGQSAAKPLSILLYRERFRD